MQEAVFMVRRAAVATTARRNQAIRFARCALGFVLVTLAGCATNPFADRVTGPSYQPSNIYREEAVLPTRLKRLAVLPLTVAGDQAETEFGRDTLWPVLLEELGRAKQFEVVPVSVEQLVRWTGRSGWTGEEPLPEHFFEAIRAGAGVEGVLVCRLTRYRAYEPLAVGWRLKLVDNEDPRVIWAVDEIFDAREPAVCNAARRFAQSHPEAAPVNDSHGILRSPRRFAQYTASEVFKTLPARAPSPPPN